MKRSSGILLPVTALPSPYGVGSMGKAAYDFVDFLADAGQSWWQILPVGPTGYGDSPYQSFSTHAGNPYLIDLDLLRRDGLVKQGELDALPKDGDPAHVDYGVLYQTRLPLLRRAAERLLAGDATPVAEFLEDHILWLPDYALFMALKRKFGMKSWTEWPDENIRLRRPGALERYGEELEHEMRLEAAVQYLFVRQWASLRRYAAQKGVGIIGDLPIYVALDSADVWSEPKWFQLDERRMPTEVAGVPPDYFTADGQLWGNPLYDWEALWMDRFRWWVRRVRSAARLYDVVRLDHFRGLESYWAVPAGEGTARNGHWVKGPGLDLVRTLKEAFPDLPIIAEDLGYLTPEVGELLEASGFPGMKVLQFAFDSREAADYRPHTYPRHCVCYAGTHDNTTLAAWKTEADPADVDMARRYLGLNEEEGFCAGMLRGGLSCAADLFIAQMQDWLELGADARTNTPGTTEGNWRWRLRPGQASPELAARMRELMNLYGR